MRLIVVNMVIALLAVTAIRVTGRNEEVRVGEPFPVEVQRHAQLGTPPCGVYFLGTVTCIHCRRLARAMTQSDSWEDVRWILLDGQEGVAEFADSTGFPAERIVPVAIPGQLRVPVTPVRVVVNAAGAVTLYDAVQAPSDGPDPCE